VLVQEVMADVLHQLSVLKQNSPLVGVHVLFVPHVQIIELAIFPVVSEQGFSEILSQKFCGL